MRLKAVELQKKNRGPKDIIECYIEVFIDYLNKNGVDITFNRKSREVVLDGSVGEFQD